MVGFFQIIVFGSVYGALIDMKERDMFHISETKRYIF